MVIPKRNQYILDHEYHLYLNIELCYYWDIIYILWKLLRIQELFPSTIVDGISKHRAGPTRHEKSENCVLLEVLHFSTITAAF